MQIEAGKYYVRRDGVEAGPAKANEHDSYPWIVGGETYTDSGLYFSFATTASDLVSEATPAEKASAHVTSLPTPAIPVFDYEPGDRVTVIADRTGFAKYVGQTGTVYSLPSDDFTSLAVTLDNGDQRFFLPTELAPLESFEVGDWVIDPDGDICIVFHDDGTDDRQFTVGSTVTGESYSYGPASLQHYCPECDCDNDNDDLEVAVDDLTDALAYILDRARAA